ncbi:hypothetical protein PG994_000569 [Apiospora phragmitis]|uniref:Uncharacterized protein n=1 Tax=Apiospora phragmitis TaxID=2905665 RepID=A0ABR1X6T6_9PEZI
MIYHMKKQTLRVAGAWRYEAQRALQAVILITDPKQVEARLTSAGCAGVRQIIIALAPRWDMNITWSLDIHDILNASAHMNIKRSLDIHDILNRKMPHLQSLVLRQGIQARLGFEQLRPTELANLSGLRELTLVELGRTGYSPPLLFYVPHLEHLHLSHAAWEALPISALLPGPELPSFSLKSLEISGCNIHSEPLRRLLANSAGSLCRLSLVGLQAEWDTFIHLAAMRAEGLLPKVRHLTFSRRDTANSSYIKNLPRKVTDPLAYWGGIKTAYIRTGDVKMSGAIINGIAALSPLQSSR